MYRCWSTIDYQFVSIVYVYRLLTDNTWTFCGQTVPWAEWRAEMLHYKCTAHSYETVNVRNGSSVSTVYIRTNMLWGGCVCACVVVTRQKFQHNIIIISVSDTTHFRTAYKRWRHDTGVGWFCTFLYVPCWFELID